MAKMYSRARGNSGSKRPSKQVLPSWLRYKSKEVELLIVKLAKEGKTASQIGIALRDLYGIPNVRQVIRRKINSVLIEKKMAPDLPEDLSALISHSIQIRKHMERNKQDECAHRGLQLTESKINRLAAYYKKKGKLPQDWKYDPTRVRLIV